MKTAFWYTSSFVVVIVYLYVYLVESIHAVDVQRPGLRSRTPGGWPPGTPAFAMKDHPPGTPSTIVETIVPAPPINAPPPLNFSYHNYEQMTEWLKHISVAYSNLTSLYSIGKSVQGSRLIIFSFIHLYICLAARKLNVIIM